jgi:serine/threonine protein kinase
MDFSNITSGARIGEYVLIEKLGSGGFGEVWKAEHEMLHHFVAIKILKEGAGISSLIKEGEVLHLK